MASSTNSGSSAVDGEAVEPSLISTNVEGPDFERGADGLWRYRDTDVPVLGAEDVTVADMVAAREVRKPGAAHPDAVLLSLSELMADKRLGWVLQEGTRLTGGEDELFLVPWPIWQERSGEPVDVRAPERERGLAGQLVIPERDLRLLRRQLEDATSRRARAIAIAVALGSSRRQIGQQLDLSGARVQQLLDEMSTEAHADVDRFLARAHVVLERVGSTTVDRQEFELPGWSTETLDLTVDELIDWDLMTEDVNEGRATLRVSDRGATLLERRSDIPARSANGA